MSSLIRYVLAEAHAFDTKLVRLQERSDEIETALHERLASCDLEARNLRAELAEMASSHLAARSHLEQRGVIELALLASELEARELSLEMAISISLKEMREKAAAEAADARVAAHAQKGKMHALETTLKAEIAHLRSELDAISRAAAAAHVAVATLGAEIAEIEEDAAVGQMRRWWRQESPWKRCV